MKNYTVLKASEEEDLERMVQDHLNRGYVLIGGVCAVPTSGHQWGYFVQAVAMPFLSTTTGTGTDTDALRTDYDPSRLGNPVRGKHYKESKDDTPAELDDDRL